MTRTANDPKSLRVAGLFAGIGGLELGLERAGHKTMFLCELHDGARAVLQDRFPGIPLEPDIRHVDSIPRDTQLLTAGFPCQDLSQAGGTRGIKGRKSGLVKHLFELIEERPVKWVLIENVPFMLSLGGGAAMRYLTDQLERLGYKWAYRAINTLAFGLPQRRERVFLLASRSSDPAKIMFADSVEPRLPDASTANAFGFYWTEGRRGLGWAVESVPTLKGGSTVGIPSPPAIWLPEQGLFTPEIRDAERLQGFAPDWTIAAESKNGSRKTSRWLLVGNAVTVDVAHWVGQLFYRKPGHLPSATRDLDKNQSWPNAAFGKPGQKTRAVDISTWPVACKFRPLSEFLEFGCPPLSQRAAKGFLERYKNGTLRKKAELIEALRAHLAQKRLGSFGLGEPGGRHRPRISPS